MRLNGGRLEEAERDFRQLLAANPQVGGAYANLGVVYMRRKQWSESFGDATPGGTFDAASGGNPLERRAGLFSPK